jgi:hypothetical protein
MRKIFTHVDAVLGVFGPKNGSPTTYSLASQLLNLKIKNIHQN